MNIDGGYLCECPENSQLAHDQHTCIENVSNLIDCTRNNGGCAQVCNSQSKHCECYPGYQTIDDGKTCIDVNECENNNGNCSHTCINEYGGYQ